MQITNHSTCLAPMAASSSHHDEYVYPPELDSSTLIHNVLDRLHTDSTAPETSSIHNLRLLRHLPPIFCLPNHPRPRHSSHRAVVRSERSSFPRPACTKWWHTAAPSRDQIDSHLPRWRRLRLPYQICAGERAIATSSGGQRNGWYWCRCWRRRTS